MISKIMKKLNLYMLMITLAFATLSGVAFASLIHQPTQLNETGYHQRNESNQTMLMLAKGQIVNAKNERKPSCHS